LKKIIKDIWAESGDDGVDIKVIKLSPKGGSLGGSHEEKKCDCPTGKQGGSIPEGVKESLTNAVNVEELWNIHKNEHYPNGLPEGTDENTLKYGYLCGMNDTIQSMRTMNALSQMGVPNEFLNQFVQIFERSIDINCSALHELLFKNVAMGATIHNPHKNPENN